MVQKSVKWESLIYGHVNIDYEKKKCCFYELSVNKNGVYSLFFLRAGEFVVNEKIFLDKLNVRDHIQRDDQNYNCLILNLFEQFAMQKKTGLKTQCKEGDGGGRRLGRLILVSLISPQTSPSSSREV